MLTKIVVFLSIMAQVIVEGTPKTIPNFGATGLDDLAFGVCTPKSMRSPNPRARPISKKISIQDSIKNTCTFSLKRNLSDVEISPEEDKGESTRNTPTMQEEYVVPCDEITGIHQILIDRKDVRFGKDLMKDLDNGKYQHCIVPITVGDALVKFLTKYVHDDLIRDESYKTKSNETVLTANSTKLNDSVNFIDKHFMVHSKKFEHYCNTLMDGIQCSDPSDFMLQLNERDLDLFREARGKLSKWYVKNKHLMLKLNTTSKSRDVLGFTLNCNPQAVSKDFAAEIFQEFECLRQQLETKASACTLREVMNLEEIMEDFIDKSLADTETKFITFKAFRAVILNNKEISNEWLPRIPKIPSFQRKPHFIKPNVYSRNIAPVRKISIPQPKITYSRPTQQTNSRNDSFYDAHAPPQREFKQDNYRPREFHSRTYQQERRDYLPQKQYNWETQNLERNPRTYRNDDFPPYDSNFKQKKDKYKAYDDDDEVFHPAGRQYYRY